MKFVIAVVVLALIACAQSSVLPLSYTAVSGPTLLQAAPGAIIAGPAPYFAAHAPYLAAPFIRTAPIVHAAQYVAAPLVAAEGTYIAKNRGAVHVAPLEGHANSAASINLEPAPGTL